MDPINNNPLDDDDVLAACGFFFDNDNQINDNSEKRIPFLNTKQNYNTHDKETLPLYKVDLTISSNCDKRVEANDNSPQEEVLISQVTTGPETTKKNVGVITNDLNEPVAKNKELVIFSVNGNSEKKQLNSIYDKEHNSIQTNSNSKKKPVTMLINSKCRKAKLTSFYYENSIFNDCKYNNIPRKYLLDCMRKKFKVAKHKFIKRLLHKDGIKVKNLSQEFICTINIEFNKPQLENTYGEIYKNEKEIIEKYHNNRKFKSSATNKKKTKTSNNFEHNKSVVIDNQSHPIFNLKYKEAIKEFLESDDFQEQLREIRKKEGYYYCKIYQEVAQNYWIYYETGKPNKKIKNERELVVNKSGLGRKRKSQFS
jgi:hypothetical protein